MKNYIYVVVIVGEDHNAKTAVIAGEKELKGLSLSKVLAMGWVPVRETAMGGGSVAHSLLVLEYEGSGMNSVAAAAPAAASAPSPVPASVSAPAPVAPITPVAPKAAAVKAAVVDAPKKPGLTPKAAVAPAAAPAAAGDDKPAAGKKPSDSDISFDFLNDDQ